MAKVVITDWNFADLSVERALLEPLGLEVVEGQAKTEEALLPLVAEADYVITQFAPLTARVIGAMSRARIIVRYGVGVDNVDLAAAAARGLPVCNIPDYCTDEVADHALALILSLTRRVPQISGHVKAGQWKLQVPVDQILVLKALTVGLVGFGRIGQQVARRLLACKARVLAYDPVADPEKVRAAGCEPVSLEELLAQSDLVSLHCPSTEQTRYLINRDSLARMKPGALLVNTSRGTLVRTEDLVAALRSGQLSAAALDVTDPEPIPGDSPLLGMEQVVITGHIASVSVRAEQELRTTAAELVAQAVRGEKLPNVVNGVGA